MRLGSVKSQGKIKAFPQFLLAFMGILPKLPDFCPILPAFYDFRKPQIPSIHQHLTHHRGVILSERGSECFSVRGW
jgi:hypothetical protein